MKVSPQRPLISTNAQTNSDLNKSIDIMSSKQRAELTTLEKRQFDSHKAKNNWNTGLRNSGMHWYKNSQHTDLYAFVPERGSRCESQLDYNHDKLGR